MASAIGDDVFRQAVIDHAVALGMDPETDSQFLWLAEEALLAQLPVEWSLCDDEHGNQFYYNSKTGESTWENPLDEPYRKMFQKLKTHPETAPSRRPRDEQWGHFPGNKRISERVRGSLEAKTREMARELGLEEKSYLSSSGSEVDDDDSEATGKVHAKKVELVVNHRSVSLPNGEYDIQYLVRWETAEQDWLSAAVLLTEFPDVVHEYNNTILRKSSDTYCKQLDDMQEEFNKRLASEREACNEIVVQERRKQQLLDQECEKLRAQVLELDCVHSKASGKSSATVLGLENKLKVLMAENEQLKTQLNNINRSENGLEWREKAEGHAREKDRLVADKKVLESMLENVKRELNDELSSNLNTRKQVVQLESELEASKRERRKLEQQLEASSTKDSREVQELRGQRDNAKAELDSLREHFAAELSKQRIALSEAKPATDQGAMMKLDATLQQSKQLCTSLQDEVSEKSSEIINLREQLESSQRKMSRIENERAVFEVALEKIKTELATELLSSQKVEQKLHEATATVESQKRQQTVLENLCEQLKATVKELETKLAAVPPPAPPAPTHNIEQLLADLKTSKDTEQKWKRQVSDIEKTVQNLKQELGKKENEISDLQAELLSTKEHAETINRSRERGDSQRNILEESLKAMKLELKREIENNQALEAELRNKDVDSTEKDEAERKIKSLENALKRCKQEMDSAIRAHESKSSVERDAAIAEIRGQVEKENEARISKLQEELVMLRSREDDAEKVEALEKEMRKMRIRVADEVRKRRILHNKVVDLQGNIRVYCRVRPVLDHEKKSGKADVVIDFPNEGEIKLQQSLSCRDQEDNFEFDQVFDSRSTQAQVFEEVQPLTHSALDGYNVCIFAYGQTGSGKTYTMDGSEADRGVIHRTFQSLFDGIKERQHDGSVRYAIKLTLLEIYNETICDLLDNRKKDKKLQVRQGEHGLHVPGLTEKTVENIDQIKELMEQGIQNRTTGTHNINQHSSRSHLVVTVHLVADHKKKDKRFTTRSKLHLIDLAGSERLDKTNASGNLLQEAKSINKSLSALGNVIQALGSAGTNGHVPFRDSKLTFLLQDSLSGSSKVLMFVNISPVEWNAPESLCSLTFAARCRKVALGKAKKEHRVKRGCNPEANNRRPSKPTFTEN
uniref:Kinesin-like protein n=1 Tax=Mucochytrium quahogii TaxID=96639 RepID=A0A7S2WE81_9STRA|mmetsp:Transcript_20426/g.44376  ORF Transcript_20426/g.44376 Transcript_20426/m.44376 type:complete len:1146 (+) Transcript_20426:384-3821(+)